MSAYNLPIPLASVKGLLLWPIRKKEEKFDHKGAVT
jgi:hypothetical protein